MIMRVAVLLVLTGCPPPPGQDPAVARGRQAYMGTCIACHNVNPAVDGAVGPAVKGSSRELLEARVVRGQYPTGYKPKRDTHVMPPQPAIAPSIDDLYRYLNAP